MYLVRLKELRKQKNFTQNQVAEYLKISPPAYSHYETGFTEPDVANLIKLSELYEVSVDYILGITDDKDLSFISEKFKKLAQDDQQSIKNIIKRLAELSEKK